MIKTILILTLFAKEILCTTEWFGDLRAHLNPPQSPPFYDIVYDESDCPFGMESIAIPEYVYFGEMIATKSVNEHSQCLQFCLETPRCEAVNYFESFGKRGHGFCELLVETQYDNPRLMRPFKKAIYYEKIRCRTSSDDEDQPFNFDSKGTEGQKLLLGLNGVGVPKGAETHRINEQKPILLNNNETKWRKAVNNYEDMNMTTTTLSTILSEATDVKKRSSVLKKITEKINEFNLRFKSR